MQLSKSQVNLHGNMHQFRASELQSQNHIFANKVTITESSTERRSWIPFETA